MNRTKPSMIAKIELNGREVTYELFRGAYRNINLRIRGDGSVRVSAHWRVPQERIEAFLISNAPFLLAQLDAVNRLVPEEAPWRDGGCIPILGRDRQIYVRTGGKTEAILDGDTVRVTVRILSEEQIKKAVRELMERESERLILAMCPSIFSRFSAYVTHEPDYCFRYMVSRWGSCCPAKDQITFNKFLICVPVDCVEYVIVHEMAHLVELNHSPAFRKIVEEILPDWRERKERMKPYGFWLRKL